ncbi:hypothetical protein GMORB2_1194 [Geosmithia morbida]|uniref:Uncharacterized protein n=1 Tax=Geosmithia morbida TaxID=1094350 RepID=A0A9P4YZI9_9HYPO|nr:uncharacterized protein GMORB2_1194 [Geosmithia morbida]KAF4125948.1 hypothetical protein GMORB2_1194 [Geosmithia morbida]
MSPFSNDFPSASPVMAMSPQPVHQSPFAAPFTHQPFYPQPKGHPTSALMSLQTPVRLGKKRSRDEAASNLEPDVPLPKAEEPEDEWVYGPGMVLITANKGYIADATNQSGTWLEEKKAVDKETRRKQEEAMLPQRNSKLRRRDLQNDAKAGGLTMTIASPTTSGMGEPSPTTTEPVFDNVSLHLGIGWKKMSDDEHVQAAARGWARYIENHFPVTDACIRLESKGLQSYLVESSEGFYLFSENLHQGRLVSTNIEGAIRNLQSSPPIFDGADILTKADSPCFTTAHGDSEMHMG